MDIKQFISSTFTESFFTIDFKYHESYEGSVQGVNCYVCHGAIAGPAYVNDTPTLAMHKTCAESPSEIQHPLHPHHPLNADVKGHGFVCKGCGQYGFSFGYCCNRNACDFKIDFPCASNLSIQKEEKILEIQEDFHDHKLQRFRHNTSNRNGQIDIFCSYCSKSFNGWVFGCTLCNLFFHEPCVPKIPYGKEIRTPFHLEHPLLLEQSQSGGALCRVCYEVVWRGDMVLSCHVCGIYEGFHLSCASVSTFGLGLKQYHMEHPMLYAYVHRDSVDSSELYYKKRRCVVCNRRCEKSHVYTCLDCDAFVHLECIPLPRVVKHQSHSYDDHVLTLSDLTSRQDFPLDRYHCLVCEEQGDLNHPFYHCQECSDMAHIDCILSEEDPPVEILEYLVPFEKSVNDSDEESSAISEEVSDDEPVDLEECSLAEIDERIVALKKERDEIALQIDVYEEERQKKINSLSQMGSVVYPRRA